jgi:hypothetical protein
MKQIPNTPEYTIIAIISDQNFVEFQKKVKEFKQNKVIVTEKTGVSMVPMANGREMMVMAIPYCYIEYGCTKSDHDTWRFQQTLHQ